MVQRLLQQCLPYSKKIWCQGTVFVITDRLRSARHLSPSEIQEMVKSGLVEIGSHSVSHSDLTQIPNDKVWHEIYHSKKLLEQISGCEIVSFAYPFGKVNDRVAELIKQTGYRVAFRIGPSLPISNADHLYKLNRIAVREDTNLQALFSAREVAVANQRVSKSL
ncbi:MAG: polysaccharide deacetylase family protein [Deltaproteobacteria bacterium]|nr:polysaccharide deacetylase family protein [Deltaproteobacteria bacterium]